VSHIKNQIQSKTSLKESAVTGLEHKPHLFFFLLGPQDPSFFKRTHPTSFPSVLKAEK